MKEEIALAFIFAQIVNSVLCQPLETVPNLQCCLDQRKRSVEKQEMLIPAQAIDASLMLTNQRNLYENNKHQVVGTTFTHKKMMLQPSAIAQMHTIGGQVNYRNKPSDVLLTFKTQRTNDNPTQIGLDGKMNLYTSPLGMVGIDGNLGYNRLIGVPSYLANPAWEAGLDVNLINTIFLRGSVTLRL